MVSFTTSSYVSFDSTKSMHVLLNHLPLVFFNSTIEEEVLEVKMSSSIHLLSIIFNCSLEAHFVMAI